MPRLQLRLQPLPERGPAACPPTPSQALGGKVPPGLLVCRAAAADLQDRLQQYAAVSGRRSGLLPGWWGW